MRTEYVHYFSVFIRKSPLKHRFWLHNILISSGTKVNKIKGWYVYIELSITPITAIWKDFLMSITLMVDAYQSFIYVLYVYFKEVLIMILFEYHRNYIENIQTLNESKI